MGRGTAYLLIYGLFYSGRLECSSIPHFRCFVLVESFELYFLPAELLLFATNHLNSTYTLCLVYGPFFTLFSVPQSIAPLKNKNKKGVGIF